ncbi:hypothetical protein ABPG72_022577 [Tetrahymena utriculariae]
MKQINLIFTILTLIRFLSSTCNDPNADENNNCQCKDGYYGISQDQPDGFCCTKCPRGTTTTAGIITQTVVKCNRFININAYYDNVSNSCFCNSGYYGSALDAYSYINCPRSTTTAAGIIAQCIDPNAYNNGADISIYNCNERYCGIPINDYKTSRCTICPSDATSGQATSSSNIAECNSETNASQQAGESDQCNPKDINQSQNAKDNENKSYLIAIVVIPIF